MKFKCLVDTCFMGTNVKKNVTVVDIEWDISESNPNWYRVKDEAAKRSPVRPKAVKDPK